jgi:hypothetical protein
MTTTEIFLRLIQKPEGQLLDFKSEHYNLSNEYLRGNFIKDIVSMANTPREQSAYIVLGVKANPDGTNECVGLDKAVDDSIYQNCIRPKVNPCPLFTYTPLQSEGKHFALIEIPFQANGPFEVSDDLGPLKAHAVYWRVGSNNMPARHDEREKIVAWFKNDKHDQIVLPNALTSPWKQFQKSVYNFDDNRIYILILGNHSPVSKEDILDLANAPITFVFDFDNQNNDNSLAKYLLPHIRTKRSIKELTLGDSRAVFSNSTCYWYYANGIADRGSTLPGEGWRSWQVKYGRDISEQIRQIATGRNSKPATVICTWNSQPHAETIFSSFLESFGENVNFVVAHPDAALANKLQAQYDASLIEIELGHISSGLRSVCSESNSTSAQLKLLPTKAGTKSAISMEHLHYLEEELEIVDITAGTVSDPADDTCSAFFRGKQISWFGLGINCDVTRDITNAINQAVLFDLGGDADKRSKGTKRINLYHAPGSGGSTVGRRIAWNIHMSFPTAILKRCTPIETADRLQLLYKYTSLPILLLAEGADIQDSAIEDLYKVLKSRQMSVVFLNILRRYSTVVEKDRSFYLSAQLSLVEATRFRAKLSAERPDKRTSLERLTTNGSPEELTPFYFALETFEADFIGIAPYVKARIAECSNEQLNILVFLAIAYYYGQQSLPAAAFADLLDLPSAKQVSLELLLPLHLRDLLRYRGKSDWRVAHNLIAHEILSQSLASGSRDSRAWRQNLSAWAIKFSEFCRGSAPIASSDMVEIASRCFLLRDNREPMDSESSASGATSQFSLLLQDVPSVNGRLSILVRLTELFSGEAHFWGHLGRFYSLEMADMEQSLYALNQAISLNPEDSVLYHMTGMALRMHLYGMMSGPVPTKDILPEIINLTNRASEQFAIARDLEPDSEHGYISNIQMLLRVLDYARRAHAKNSVAELVVDPSIDSNIREYLGLAEQLLDQARNLREGDRSSEYVQRCRVQLDGLYGNYETVIQGWNNLLARKGVYFPPIRRQLVYAYLARRDRKWQTVSHKELTKIIGLLDQNLMEEPNDSRTLRLWMQAVRRADPPQQLSRVVERVSYWRASSKEIEPVFYLYILYALQALEGSALVADRLRENVEECRKRAKQKPNRTGSFEWIGNGRGLNRLVHYSELGQWSEEKDFWTGSQLLERVEGFIVSINGPESGLIEFKGGLKAFFVPGKSNHLKGQDENRRISCYLGFSYDGPRAWEVKYQ